MISGGCHWAIDRIPEREGRGVIYLGVSLTGSLTVGSFYCVKPESRGEPFGEPLG
jgi:hypothetical protein